MTAAKIKNELFAKLSEMDDDLEYESFERWVTALESAIEEFNKDNLIEVKPRAFLLEWLKETTPE